ncbi:MAG: zinc-binding dehydrogenase, partial [Chloroflexi bacterium]|nr:zinc-binding dehydrogenase [Chloroflexota bacterium]
INAALQWGGDKLFYPARHIRWKIIAPYAVLTIILAGVGTFLAMRVVTGSLEERFENQLAEAARVTADSVVRQERRHLELVRGVAFTEGMAGGVRDGGWDTVGALVEPLAVTVHGLRQAGLTFGERVAIIGSGTIGLMALIAARALGASDVFITARHAHQADAARALGAAQVVEANGTEIEKLTAAFGGRPPDVVVETVGGSGETLDQAITLAAPGGRVSILGIFTGPATVNATAAVMKEVTLYGGITYGRPGSRSDFEVALQIAAQHTEDLRRVITHRVKLADIERGFATAADKSQGSIKVTVEV